MAENREERVILIRVDASAAIDGSQAATRALERLEKAQGSAGASLSRMEEGLGRVGGFLKAQLAIQVAEIGARLVGMAKSAIDAAAGMGELADQMGVTTQGLQALQFSAAQNGLKFEQLEGGMAKFSQKIGDAANGSKDMIDSLNRVGVKIIDTRGQLRATEAVLGDVALAITSIDDPARQTAAAVDFFGKSGAKMIPMLKDIASGMDAMQARAKAAGAVISDDTIAKLDAMADRASVAALRWRALFAEVAAPIITTGLDNLNKSLAEIISQLERGKASGKGFWETVLNDSKASGRIGSGPNALRLATPEELEALRREALQRELAANADDPTRRQMVQDDLDRLNRRGMIDRQAEADSQEAWARRFKPAEVLPPGVSNPTPTGAGEDVANAIAKLRRDTARDVEAAGALAEASAQGARAVADLETHFKALKAAQDAYGKTADTNRAGVAALTAELEKQLQAAQRLSSLKAFNLGTEDLDRQNELLAAENGLLNASVETRARELGLIKARQEIEAKGLDASNEKERAAIERRTEAITQNERLKAQADELRKANELWTAPLKSALESIQRTGADAFEQMLESGNFTFESLGQTFRKIITRMAAEFLALATIRPVMSVLVNAISPAMGQQLGLSGSSFPGLGGGSMAGATGGGSLFGGGGMFSGLGDWLGTPLTGPYAGMSPSSMAGVPMLSPSLMNPSSWSITGGQALGALGGLGMGVYSLATANGNTGKTIGGIASMIGAGVSLIPGVGQIAGPIIGLLGGLLPGLFGGGQQEPPTMRGIGSLDWSAGTWRSQGAGYGGGKAIDLAPVGTSISALLQGAGVNLGGLAGSYGLRQESIAKGDFSSTTTFVNGKQWGQGSTERDIGLDSAMATIAHQMMMEIGSGISDTMRVGLSNFGVNSRDHVISTKELAQAVSDLQNFEATLKSLSQTTTNAEQALASIDNQFAGLYDTANRYGLGTGGIDAAKNKARSKLGSDFADSLSRQLMGDQEGALFDLEKERKDLIETNNAYKAIAGYADQAAKIEELYAKKRAAILEQYAASSTKALAASYQSLIDRLTFGDLANASPTTSYSGQRATYLATLAQARGGDTEAAGRLSSVAEAYVNAGRAYFGSSADYAAIAEQIRRDLLERQAATLGPENGAQAAAFNALIKQAADMQGMVTTLTQAMQSQSEQIAALTAQLARRA